jgi:hypothetical protein
MKWEFDEAGIAWEPFGARVEGLRALIERLRAEFASDGYPQQQPLREQFGIPAAAAGAAQGVRRSRATADRRWHRGAGAAGGGRARRRRRGGRALQLKGSPPGTMRIATDTEIDGRVRFARECAGDRDVEWHILVQAVVPADDREAAASGLAERFGNVMSAARSSPRRSSSSARSRRWPTRCCATASAGASATTPSTARSERRSRP